LLAVHVVDRFALDQPGHPVDLLSVPLVSILALLGSGREWAMSRDSHGAAGAALIFAAQDGLSFENVIRRGR